MRSVTCVEMKMQTLYLSTGLAFALLTAGSAYGQQPATKRFEQQNIPISEIFAEWDQKGLSAEKYICSCQKLICDTRPYWPFRTFTEGQPIPVLGDFNRSVATSNGFYCFRR